MPAARTRCDAAEQELVEPVALDEDRSRTEAVIGFVRSLALAEDSDANN